jgi:hypothetical protein
MSTDSDDDDGRSRSQASTSANANTTWTNAAYSRSSDTVHTIVDESANGLERLTVNDLPDTDSDGAIDTHNASEEDLDDDTATLAGDRLVLPTTGPLVLFMNPDSVVETEFETEAGQLGFSVTSENRGQSSKTVTCMIIRDGGGKVRRSSDHR